MSVVPEHPDLDQARRQAKECTRLGGAMVERWRGSLLSRQR